MKKAIITIIIIIAIAVGYYLISPLFIDVAVDDALPENIIAGGEQDKNAGENLTPSGEEKLSAEEKEKLDKEMEEMAKIEEEPMEDNMPEMIKEDNSSAGPFPVMGTAGHPASGEVKILETESGTVIRYENFSSINGPHLNVYLANDLEASTYYDLGAIKGTSGNINYAVPNEINIKDYKYVMYWCVPFRVLFNYAEIN